MRVLFTTSNWTGDYFCVVPTAWALQAAGHDVRVACAPGQAEMIRNSGLTAVPILHSIDLMRLCRFGHFNKSAEGNRPLPDLPLPLTPAGDRQVTDLSEIDVKAEGSLLWDELAPILRRSSDEAVAFARNWRPDLVIYSLMSEAGPLSARVCGVPAVYHCPGFFGAAERGNALDLGTDDMTGSFVRHGVEPWRREDTEYVIDPSPEASAPPHADALRIPVQFVPYNGPGTVPPWLLAPAEKNRICMLWGRSVTEIFGPDLPALRYAIDAAAGLDVEVLLTVGPKQVKALGDLPDCVRVMTDFPFQHLLDTCDAVVHHSSAGSLMTSFIAGMPQLALPVTDDQIVTGERAAKTGSVLALPALTASFEDVQQAIKSVLTDTYRGAALRQRRDLMARPTPAQIVPTLERIARS
jgi:UDP:flavonoid glycosyltransferase YjiC (YdhE family)